jgi:hypothetical protein
MLLIAFSIRNDLLSVAGMPWSLSFRALVVLFVAFPARTFRLVLNVARRNPKSQLKAANKISY